MRLLAMIAVLVTASACGEPVLRNVPQPNKNVMAGAAAAIAGAATLADPQGQAKRVEANKVPDEQKPQRSKGTVPADVLDRLDEQQHAKQPAPSEP